MPPTYRVGIAGFGIAGAASAILLARAGHQVTVFEQAPNLGPVGAGFLLQPSGQAVLKRLGLLDPILADSEPIHALKAYTARGGTLVHLHYSGAAPGRHAYGVHRGRLFETLHAAVRAESVPIRLEHHITAYRETGQEVFAIDARGQDHGPFDVLVAADGSRSSLRGALNPDLKAREYEYGAMWTVGRCTKVHGYLHQLTRGTRNLLGLLPIGGERCTLFWGLALSEMEPLRRRGFAAWRAEVIRFSPLAEEVFDTVQSFDQVAFTGYQHTAPRRVHSQRLVLAGDAAHAMSPHLGQGANLALLDAECLAEVLGTAQHPAEAFCEYRRRRAGQSGYYASLSRLLTPFFQSDADVLGLGRDIALPLMTLIPPLRKQMELSLAGAKRGWLSADPALLAGGAHA
jgi:2-polyprenyl-6-methoxyphenol hydroxylase-like FAD-dependent oxidoreductase